MVLIVLSVIALLCATITGAALLRTRPSPGSLDRVADRLDDSGRWWERAAATLPAEPARYPRPAGDDWPLGLAVTALAADPVGCGQQDVYYVQRNVIALARGLSATGAAQRAAALTLSAVLASPPGQAEDGGTALCRSFSSANRLVRSVSQREPKHSDMAATLDVVVIAVEDGQPSLHFGHVGNASIWLQRAASMSVELLTESHAIHGGPLLRAVGVSPDLVPDTGQVPVAQGDRIFLTTASRYVTFTSAIMNDSARAGGPLRTVVAALADAALSDAVLAEAALSDAALADAALAEAGPADAVLADAALAAAVRSAAAPEGVTIIAAEVGRPASFQA